MSVGKSAHSRKTRPPPPTAVLAIGGCFLLGDCLLVFTQAYVFGAVIVLMATGAAGFGLWNYLLATPAGRRRRATGRAVRASVELLLYLSPIAMLSIAYPIASRRLTAMDVGGVRLTTLVLAASVTVPWLTQAVCLPLFKVVAPHVAAKQRTLIVDRLCEAWPTTFVQCLPVVVLFTVPVELAMHWSLEAVATYFCLCGLYVAFAQSLIPSIVLRRRGLWALGWASVTAALLIAPALWFLPPLVGLATQLLAMRERWALLTRPTRLPYGAVARGVLRGLVLGAVLWSDKYFLFLKTGGDFPVTAVYVALLPAVLAYNYYFVRLAPRFDASIAELRRAMEEGPYERARQEVAEGLRIVAGSLGRSALVGAIIALAIAVLAAELRPASILLIIVVAVASWLAMLLTLLCYKLDYIGQSSTAEWISGLYLAACVATFFLLPLGVAPYLGLIAFDLILVVRVLRITLEQWRSPEYSLFWRHATAW